MAKKEKDDETTEPAEEATEVADIADGIYLDLDEEAYHADKGTISKTGLWTLHSKTPAHFRFAPPREHEPVLDFGKALHLAVLQPELAATKLIQGPKDRRGNKWKDALAGAIEAKGVLLPEDRYNEVMLIQETAHRHPVIKKLISVETVCEASAFWTDKRTGVRLRCRPDIYAPPIEIMADLKSTADASAWNWARTAANLGYHVQEPLYTEGWQAAGGGAVNGFVFICIEAKAPFCTVVYELEPSAAAEGQAAFETAVDKYKVCLDADEWPGYPIEVQSLDIPHYSYKETDSPHITRS